MEPEYKPRPKDVSLPLGGTTITQIELASGSRHIISTELTVMKNYFSRTLVSCDIPKAYKTMPDRFSTWGQSLVTSILLGLLPVVLFSPKLTISPKNKDKKNQIAGHISGKICFGISEFKEVVLVYFSLYHTYIMGLWGFILSP